MSYPSTLACLVVGLLAAVLIAGTLRNQPARVFCLSDQGHCATASNFDFYALSAEH